MSVTVSSSPHDVSLYHFESITEEDNNNNNTEEQDTKTDTKTDKDNIIISPIILGTISSVNNYRLQPSITSYTPLNVILFGHSLKESDIRAVAELVWVGRSVNVVDLGCNDIEDKECEMVCQALRSPSSILHSLLLSGNSISGDGAAALGSFLARTKTLMELNLRLNIIGDVGLSALSNGLKRNRTLVKLNLSTNAITADGILALADAIARNITLRELDLSGNDIGDDGVALLVKALASTRVSILYVDGTNIGPGGAASFADLLQTSSPLSALFISGNHISDEGAIAIANSLHVNDHLHRLDMGNNGVADEGAFAFAHALSMNKTFSYFSVRNNNISPAGILALATALQHQPNLFSYNLGGNQLTPMEYRHIITMLEESWRSRHNNYFDDELSSTEQPDPLVSLSNLFPSPELVSQALQYIPTLPKTFYKPFAIHDTNNVSNNIPHTPTLSTVILPKQVQEPPTNINPTHINQEKPISEISKSGISTSNNGTGANENAEQDADVLEERLKKAIRMMKDKISLRNLSYTSLPKMLRTAPANTTGRPADDKPSALYTEENNQKQLQEKETREEDINDKEALEQEMLQKKEKEQQEKEKREKEENEIKEREQREKEIHDREHEKENDNGNNDGSIQPLSTLGYVSSTVKRVPRDAKPFILKRYSLSLSNPLDSGRPYSPPRTPTPSYLPSTTPPPPTPTPPSSSPIHTPTLSPTPIDPDYEEEDSLDSVSYSPSPPFPSLMSDLSRPESSKKSRKLIKTARKPTEALPHGPPLPQITDENVDTVRSWFISGPPPFTVNRHYNRKGKKGTTTSVISFPDREGEISMQLPGAFVLQAPDLREPLLFTSPQRDLILSTLIVFIYGASTLIRNRNMQ